MGSSKTGLVGTIGVALLNPDGTTHTARATANIFEIGGGCYGKEITFPDDWIGIISWDTGGGSPVYAVDEYAYYENNPAVDTKVDDLHKLQGLDLSNPMTVTQNSREVGTIRQAISGNGRTTSTVTRTV
jgi:hypothetical protein